MKTRFFPRWLRLVAAVLLLLITFGTSTARANAPEQEILSAGFTHTCALKRDGSVDCWGSNNYGEADDQPGPHIQVSARLDHTCALTPSGAVNCWGDNTYGQSDDQSGPYIEVSTGRWYTCGLTPSRAVDCWGLNTYGQADDQPGPYRQISAGDFHTCGLTISEAVECWGLNDYGEADDQPGLYVWVSAGAYHTCAVTPLGVVNCWGNNQFGQAEDQLGSFFQVSAGESHTCGVRYSGVVDCWGDNTFGQSDDRPGPYIWVTAGTYHTCAVKPAGPVDCWGHNGHGQSENQPGPYGTYQPIGDTTPPVVIVTGVTEGSTYILGAVPQVGCSITEVGSGVAVQASLTLSGGNELGVGNFTATCSGAFDNAGNPGNTAIVNYTVAFQFAGFTSPVDNPPVMNIARAGQTIPFKWRLTDASGNPVTNLTDVTVTASDLFCESGTSGDAIEAYATSNSGLQNLGDGYYQWNWKTPTSYANSCKTFSLDLGEGDGRTALFQFRK